MKIDSIGRAATHVNLFVTAHACDLHGPRHGLPPLLHRDHVLGLVDQLLHVVPVTVQLLPQFLHTFQQSFPLVQREIGLGINGVQSLVPLRDPLLRLLNVAEELLALGSVLQVDLQAKGQLKKPGPLALHRGHIGLDSFRGRMVLKDQSLASVLHR